MHWLRTRSLVFDYYLNLFLAACTLLLHLMFGAEVAARASGTEEALMSEEHEVRLPSGIRLHYVAQGPAEGPVVLLLHGYADSSFSFSRVLPLLPREARAIAVDQRGHGRSDRPESGYTIDDFATDAVQFLDALDLRSAVVVGHSMGSFIARRLAELAPGRVAGLVLIGSAPVAAGAAMQELVAAVADLSDPVDPAFVRGFQESTVTRSVPPGFMDGVVAESLRVPARVWKAAASGLLDDRSVGGISCPTLIVGGTADGVFPPEEQSALAAMIPGARLELLDGVGHAPHWEEPERFMVALAPFLTR
jgi:non-heme chloroperoxidase